MPGAPVEAVKRVPLFAELNKRELEQVARLFKQRRFAPGETVAREGSGGAAFYLIDSGEAAVSVGGEERPVLKPGDYFGEIALIDEGARSATVTAASELVCYGLTYWDFRPLVQDNAQISWKLLQFMVGRLRAAEAAGS
jgi:CRP/FNR family transcriptional regulator, cyclic AMP receptor protein